jgi:ribonuclease HI
MSKILIYTDGGSRGNPGPAALGVYIEDGNHTELARIGKKIGETTNNVAEYSAITEGLSWLLENKNKIKIEEVHFYMDSLLAFSQITGVYKVKNTRIRDFIFEIRQKEAELGIPIFYNHVPRERNKKADLMVNLALDNAV